MSKSLAIFHAQEIFMGSHCRIDGSRLFFSHEHKWDDRLDSFVSSCMLMGTEPRRRGFFNAVVSFFWIEGLKPVLPERNGVELPVASAAAACNPIGFQSQVPGSVDQRGRAVNMERDVCRPQAAGKRGGSCGSGHGCRRSDQEHRQKCKPRGLSVRIECRPRS